MSILIIDNNDSFTYNLVQLIEQCGCRNYKVFKNTEVDIDEIDRFSKIMLSPGPGLPADTKNLMKIIDKYHSTKSILGVCLGHQAIAEYLGASLINLTKPFHGVKSDIIISGSDDYIYIEMPGRFNAGRYHSWIVSEKDFPECLKITAMSSDGQIMSISHRELDLKGIQFHPESVMTEYGMQIIKNWLEN